MEFSKSIIENIKARYSCRSYDGKPLEQELEKKLCDYIDSINKNIAFKARIIFMTNNVGDETPVKLGTYGMIGGATNFIIGILEKDEQSSLEFGYLFEKIILFATDLNLQTCWLGGTFNRAEFAEKCNLKDNEYIAIACPVGVKKQKARLFDTAVRKLVGANNRKPEAELFFDQDLSKPLELKAQSDFQTSLEMVRIGPSASNKQPWRIIKNSAGYNFYLARTKSYPMGLFDMQKNDIGIAMCHFELTSKELGLKGKWDYLQVQKEFDGLEYMKTWVIS